MDASKISVNYRLPVVVRYTPVVLVVNAKKLIDDQVEFATSSLPSVQAYIKSGALRAIGVTDSTTRVW